MSQHRNEDRRSGERSRAPTTQQGGAVAPGRGSASSQLSAPENPQPSALSRPFTLEQIKPGGAFALDLGETEPPWVAGARKYNAAHAQLVVQFNAATDNACLDKDGKLDPQKVKRWQAAHHLEGDGKVGPQTVRAAAQWAKAREFNATQPELVAQFNDLTDGMCLDDDSGELDPLAVSKWQFHHGDVSDGQITPETIDAAKAAKAKRA